MKATKLIQLIVMIEAALIAFYFILSGYFMNQLPAQLLEYINSIEFSTLSAVSKLSWWLSGASFIIYVTSVVLLLLTKPIGKWIYLAATVVGLLAVPYFGHVVEHSVLSAIGGVSALTQGIVLALLFFTDSEFNKPKHGANSKSET